MPAQNYIYNNNNGSNQCFTTSFALRTFARTWTIHGTAIFSRNHCNADVHFLCARWSIQKKKKNYVGIKSIYVNICKYVPTKRAVLVNSSNRTSNQKYYYNQLQIVHGTLSAGLRNFWISRNTSMRNTDLNYQV